VAQRPRPIPRLLGSHERGETCWVPAVHAVCLRAEGPDLPVLSLCGSRDIAILSLLPWLTDQKWANSIENVNDRSVSRQTIHHVPFVLASNLRRKTD